ncbi:hypothetical protein EI94DRAFT_1177472 [Lactarius quietus]|nr:hypothetical protein EI94DRAFT_1177472 [Lactarius quietus]
MNSWKASLLPACEPPLITLNAGVGSTYGGLTPASSARCWYRGTPFSAAAASATAIETPRMALAPSLPLLGVPSSLIKKSSISFCCVTLRPDPISAGAMVASCTPVDAPDGTAARKRPICAITRRIATQEVTTTYPFRCRGRPLRSDYRESQRSVIRVSDKR